MQMRLQVNKGCELRMGKRGWHRSKMIERMLTYFKINPI